ncbi:AAA family ATPase [Pseudomonas chlororaphis]|uniref:AAA family ATPase n=1 Tax=Pseudomonas chlororaphis TaxID=587753 RepID=UPI002408894D|nr:AAA family ATPase [Pseudomonas chlororaphis]
MKGLKSVRVRNLRSFGVENNFIPLKKLNIFVGKNSCGKSTLLRTFPLLRQSVQADTRNPILWYGSFVDFGDLETAINSSAKEVMFDFDMDISVSEGVDAFDQFIGGLPSGSDNKNTFPILFTLGVGRGDGENVVSRLKIDVEGVAVEVVYKEKTVENIALSVDGNVLIEGFKDCVVADKGKLIPTDFTNNNKSGKQGNRYWSVERIRTSFREGLNSFITALHHQNKKPEKIISALGGMPFLPRKKVFEYLRGIFAEDKYFNDQLRKSKEEIVAIVFCYMVGVNLHKILESIDSVLSEFYSSVRYLGPVRASAERFYRYQDLQVAEVDHTGSNLPMVLNSLSPQDREDLNTWINDSFGFDLRLTNTGSHYALSIRESGASEFHNVSDMGFGYSQLLPIIVSIWLENNERRGLTFFERRLLSTKKLVIAIEQPELHLHPYLQHMFGRAIAKIAQLQNVSNFCFILETHSKHIIDAIGECIEESELGHEDVSVTLFEKDKSGFTKTQLSSFDSDGYLIDWPAGFLSP